MTQNLKQWWDAWWEADYSWEGLAKKPWNGWWVLQDGTVEEDASGWPQEDRRYRPLPEGARFATLQDYWRGQGGNLHKSPVSGKEFTVIHLPLCWENGKEAPKFDQIEIIRERLSAFEGRSFGDHTDIGLQLSGAVLHGWDLKKVIPKSERPEFRERIIVEGHVFFDGPAIFEGAIFYKHVNLGQAVFNGRANFRNASFNEGCIIQNSFFLNDADFSSITAYKDIDLDSGKFFQGLSLYSARIERHLILTLSVIVGNINCSMSMLAYGIHLNQVIVFGAVIAERCRLLGGVFVSDSTLTGGLVFREVDVGGEINIGNSIIIGKSLFQSGPRTEVPLAYREIDFGNHHGSLFHNQENRLATPGSFTKISIKYSFFFDEVIFECRQFYHPINVDECQFMRRFSMLGCIVPKGSTFESSIVEGSLWPQKQYVLAANGNKILVTPDTVLRRLHAADIKRLQMGGVYLERVNNYAIWWSDFDNERAKISREFDALPECLELQAAGNKRSEYYRKLEGDFRALKQSMEEGRDYQEVARFFRLELLARRKKLDLPRQGAEWFLSRLYEAVSDFGNSVWRPLGWLLLGLIPAFAVLYAALATTHWKQPQFPTLKEVGASMSFSASRTLPLGPWAKPETCTLIGQLLDQRQEITCKAIEPVDQSRPKTYVAGTAFWVSVLATLQSAFALILIFLAGVAARRRFQIN